MDVTHQVNQENRKRVLNETTAHLAQSAFISKPLIEEQQTS